MIKSAEEFVMLRQSKIPEEYKRASHEDAPEEIWLEIIEKHPSMREWVAHNKTTSQKILSKLVEDLNPKVRYIVATRRIAGEEILSKLVNDPDESIRLAVATNPKASKQILEKLLNDKWERVVEIAKKRLAHHEYLGNYNKQ